MDLVIGFFVFIFGIIIGSFLNVVILRHNTGRKLNGRSFCTSCGKKLLWFELVPFFSFVFQRGRCRSCRSKISWQYPLVELSTGLLFVLITLKFSGNSIIPDANFLFSIFYSLVIWCVLIAIFVYDLKHKIIPNAFVFSFIALAFVGRIIETDFINFFSRGNYLDLAAGPALFVFFFLFWYLSKGRWMGFGDAKLGLGIGFMLGWSAGISAIIIGFWIGAAVSLFILLIARLTLISNFRILRLNPTLKNLTIKSEIPLAPFLILGAVLVYFFGVNVIGWY